MRKNKDNSPHSDADASTRTCYPTQVIEATAKLGNEVCGLHHGRGPKAERGLVSKQGSISDNRVVHMQRVLRSDQFIWIGVRRHFGGGGKMAS
jgi:hypothetical protein